MLNHILRQNDQQDTDLMYTVKKFEIKSNQNSWKSPILSVDKNYTIIQSKFLDKLYLDTKYPIFKIKSQNCDIKIF